MRFILTVAAVLGVSGLAAADEKADRLKRLEAVAKKARKLAAEIVEEEPEHTRLYMERLFPPPSPRDSEANLKRDLAVSSLRAWMPRRVLGLERTPGQTHGEFLREKHFGHWITRQSVFYYDDEDFLDILADHNPGVDADRFMELAELWTISPFAARRYITETRVGKPGKPEHEAAAKKLLAEIGKK